MLGPNHPNKANSAEPLLERYFWSINFWSISFT
jgi:hypothetical protein